jgi:hypothetical protein
VGHRQYGGNAPRRHLAATLHPWAVEQGRTRG